MKFLFDKGVNKWYNLHVLLVVVQKAIECSQFFFYTGAVIKAWDLSIATMRQGELAVLLCKSEYAYGKAGSPPNIPSDSTLVFEVELFDWKGMCILCVYYY